MKYKPIFVIIFLIVAVSLPAVSYFEEGEKLYNTNKPGEALPLLKEALTLDPTNEVIYHYLGTIYEQLGDYGTSETYFKKGLSYATSLKANFYYNLGNTYFVQKQNFQAEEMYTKAIIENPRLEASYLNRANSRLNQKKFGEALADYKKYLQLKPSTPQRPEIERMITALGGMLAEEEQQRQAQQERERNLQNLLNSLQNASDNKKVLSEGTDKLKKDYEMDDILD